MEKNFSFIDYIVLLKLNEGFFWLKLGICAQIVKNQSIHLLSSVVVNTNQYVQFVALLFQSSLKI
jgi:hypothetical protein